MNDKKKSLIVAVGICIFIVLAVVSLWLFPKKVYAYEGDGGTYTPTTEESASTITEDNTGAAGDKLSSPLPNQNQWDSIKEETNKLLIGVNPEKYNNSELPSWVENFRAFILRTQVSICNIASNILLAISGIWMLHGIFAICSDGYFQFFSKFKYSMFSKNLFKIKAEDGVTPEAGNRNNGANGLSNGSNVQYNSQNYNRNNNNNNTNSNNNNNANSGGVIGLAKEKLSVPIQILKYILSEVITITIVLICLFLVKTGILITFVANLPVWFIEFGQGLTKGMNNV